MDQKVKILVSQIQKVKKRSWIAIGVIFTVILSGILAITSSSSAVAITTCNGIGNLVNGGFELDQNGNTGAAFSGTGFDALGTKSNATFGSSPYVWVSWAGSKSGSDITGNVYQYLDVQDNTQTNAGIQGWKTTESDHDIEVQRVYIGPSISSVNATNDGTNTTFTTTATSSTPFSGQEVYLSGFTGTYNAQTPYIVTSGSTSANYSTNKTFTVNNLTLTGGGTIRIAYTASSQVDSLFGSPAFDDSNVTPAAGTYDAELNANASGTLYQVLPTVAGVNMRWSLRHAARSTNETMYVIIGAGADSTGTKLSDTSVVSSFPSTFSSAAGSPFQGINSSTAVTKINSSGTSTISSNGQLGDSVASPADRAAGDSAAWSLYRGSYTVPTGNSNAYTYFGFQSESAGSIGNLLDDIQFSPVAACPITASLTTNSQVTFDPFTCVSLSACAAASGSSGQALAPSPEGSATRTISSVSVASGGGTVTSSGENITFTAPSTVGSSIINYTIDYNADGIDSQSSGTITYTVTAASGLSNCNNATTSTSYPGNDVVVTIKDSSSTSDANCSWTVPSGVYAVNYLVVGGGGGGGSGGGGAGQMVTSWPCTSVVATCNSAIPSSVTPGTVMSLTVGHGGAHGIGGEAVTPSFNTLVAANAIQAYSGDTSNFGSSIYAKGGGAGGVPYRNYFCNACGGGVDIVHSPPIGYGAYVPATEIDINYGFGQGAGAGAGSATALGSGGGAGYDTNVAAATGNTSNIVGAVSTNQANAGGSSGGVGYYAGGGGGGAGGAGGSATLDSASTKYDLGGGGGSGYLNSISGSALCYAGGGGAGYQQNTNASKISGGGSGGYCGSNLNEVGGHGSDFGTCSANSCNGSNVTAGGSLAAVNSSDPDRTPSNALPGLNAYPDTGSGGGGTDPDDILAGNGSNGVIILRWTPPSSYCPYSASTSVSSYPVACPANLNVYAGSSASINLMAAPISYSDGSTTFSVLSIPSGMSQTNSSSTGVITVSVASTTSSLIGGTYPITYQLADGSNVYTSYLNVTVLDPNQHSPISVPIDPRTTSIYLPTIALGSAANVYFCVSQLSTTYANAISITAPTASGVTQVSTGSQLVLTGTNSAVAAVASQIQLSANPNDIYLLPGTASRTLQTDVSSTDTGNANCTNGTTQTMNLYPYGLTFTINPPQFGLGHN
jgi:hypothetical protein